MNKTHIFEKKPKKLSNTRLSPLEVFSLLFKIIKYLIEPGMTKSIKLKQSFIWEGGDYLIIVVYEKYSQNFTNQFLS